MKHREPNRSAESPFPRSEPKASGDSQNWKASGEVIKLERRTFWSAVKKEIRHRRLTYATVLAFMVIGPVLTWMIFPEASWSLGLLGGAVLGGFFAFCAIPDKLFE